MTLTGPRRRTAVESPVAGLNYGAITSTARADVVRFPPPGFRAIEVQHRIGSGERRFAVASRVLMTWGALAGAGVTVADVQAAPARPSAKTAPVFLDDGTPWITPGMTANLVGEGKRPVIGGPVAVVTVVDAPNRIGFSYGTREGAPFECEQLLLLEHDQEDGAVRVTVRTVGRPLSGRGGLVWAQGRRRLDERIAAALHPARA